MKKADGRVSSLDLLIKKNSSIRQDAGKEPVEQRKQGRGRRKYLVFLLLAGLVWTVLFVYIRGYRTVSQDGSTPGDQVTQGTNTEIDGEESQGVEQHKKHAATPHRVQVHETKKRGGTQVILHDRESDTSRRKGPVNLGTSLELITD